jgi:hypothetical protein
MIIIIARGRRGEEGGGGGRGGRLAATQTVPD